MYHKVQSGDPLKIPATTFNTFIDAAQDFQQRQRSQQQRPRSSFTDHGTVLVRNDSGAGRSRFSVLGVDGVVIAPGDNLESFQKTPAVAGVTPTEDHASRFGVLLEPLPAGGIGRALLAGVCPCQVDVSDEEHRFAEVIDGDTSKLASAEARSAEILRAESGTGVQWCLVRLGGTVGHTIPAIGGQFTLVNALENEVGGGNDLDVLIMGADANKTRKRRPLTDAEAKALIETTPKSPESFHGPIPPVTGVDLCP